MYFYKIKTLHIVGFENNFITIRTAALFKNFAFASFHEKLGRIRIWNYIFRIHTTASI